MNIGDCIECEQRKENAALEALLGGGALAKACCDPFDYALKLRTGEVVRFKFATIINADWIHLELEAEDQPTDNRIPFKADRGMDVRLSDIVWVMDAPCGS